MKDIRKIQKILANENIDAWVLIQAEGKDPFFTKYISKNIISTSLAIITQNDFKIFVNSLEKENINNSINKKNIEIYSRIGGKSLENLLEKYLANTKGLKKIALNFSTMNDVGVDILGHGQYKYFTKIFLESLNDIDENDFVSAEKIIYALIDSKELSEIEKMKISAKRALNILNLAFKNITSGLTELDLVDLVHKITKETSSEFLDSLKGQVIKEEYSWEKEMCPIVLTGKNFLKGGHTLPSNTLIEKGNTIYFDFGVCLTFSDGTKRSSDIQRIGYFLKDDEISPPKYICNRFQDIIDSISLGMDSIKIGMQGFEVDKIVREYLIGKGYPTYDHSTGHAIGELTHNPGTDFTPDNSKTGSLKVQPNGTYTIEPRIPLENGVSIEEMIVVLENGKVETLCERQKEIILVK